MKRIIIFMTLLCVSYISMHIHGQTNNYIKLPKPIRNYTLDNGSAIDIAKGKNGKIYGSSNSCKDRFGTSDRAIELDENSYIETPNFFEGSNVSDGYTISFWTLIDENISKNKGNDPWTASDIPHQAFFALNGTNHDDKVLFGFERRRDRAIINRYVDSNKGKSDWGIWFWDPVNFTKKMGWYHIIISYNKAKVYLYMYYPDGTLASGLYYFGLQNLSDAKVWGLGGFKSQSFKVLDDFKVFDTPLSREQINTLHGYEAVPENNMYRINLNEDPYLSISTSGSRTKGTAASIDNNQYRFDTSTYQWIFEPTGKKNIYRIRMSYQDDRYLRGGSQIWTRIHLNVYDETSASDFEWLVIPEYSTRNTGNPGFYIKSAASPDLYLYPVRGSVQPGTQLELEHNRANVNSEYLWNLELLETAVEMNNDVINPGSNYIIKSAENPFLNSQPLYPYFTNRSDVVVSRSDFLPSPEDIWTFTKTLDGSYYIKRSDNLFLHPYADDLYSGKKLEVSQINNDVFYRPYYRWTVKQAAPFSNNYIVSPTLNTTLSMDSGSPAEYKNNITAKSDDSIDDKSNQWNIYPRSDGYNQIYFIKPGIYKMESSAAASLCMSTRRYESSIGSQVVGKPYEQDRFTSFYWEIDYERDNEGKPIQDGTYLIKLFGTDNHYVHTSGSKMNEYNTVDVWGMEQENIETYKWSITPSKTSNQYYIRLAGNNNMYLHLRGNETYDGVDLDISKYYSTAESTLSWKLEELTPIEAPVTNGVYQIKFHPDQSKMVHPAGGLITPGTRLDLYVAGENPENYLWSIEKQPTNTYLIKQKRNFGELIHPAGGYVDDGVALEIWPYEYESPRCYQWIIEKSNDAYIFKNVDNPTKWMHTAGGSTKDGTRIELYKFDSSEGIKNYQWKLSK